MCTRTERVWRAVALRAEADATAHNNYYIQRENIIMADQQEKIHWLQSQYQEVSSGCPEAKRVKLADIHHQLDQRFTKCSHHEASKLIQEAFPSSLSKRCTKSRTKHVCGIEVIITSPDPSTSTGSQLSVR